MQGNKTEDNRRRPTNGKRIDSFELAGAMKKRCVTKGNPPFASLLINNSFGGFNAGA